MTLPETLLGPENRASTNGVAPPADMELARAVLSGSEPAWEAFVQRYAGLIWAVCRRTLYSGDPELMRTVFVNTLVSLRRRKLATYQGRASLATWVAVVTRTETLDALRHARGRRQLPVAVRRLAPLDQEIVHLYHAEGLSVSETVRRLATRDRGFTALKLVSALRRIEDLVGARTLRRLADERQAHNVGATSADMLAYVDHVRDETRHRESTSSADFLLMEREARVVGDELSASIARLPAADREALTLRFEHGWSARRIAERLGLRDARSAYTLIERVLRSLRRRVDGDRADRQRNGDR